MLYKRNEKGGLTADITTEELDSVKDSFGLSDEDFEKFLDYIHEQDMSIECSFYGQVEEWLHINTKV